MTIVAQTYPFVIGVDTHARSHAVCVLRAPLGEVVAGKQFPATTSGLTRAVAWAAERCEGNLAALWVIEGIGSYGARLARVATDAGYAVVEAATIDRHRRHAVGKSDTVDAQLIAESVLALEATTLRRPRRDDGIRAAVQVLLSARDQMSTERTAAINALTALLRSHDLGIDARRPLSATSITTISHWRSRSEDLAATTARAEAIRLARRIADLDTHRQANRTQIRDLLQHSPARVLLHQHGIGPITAAAAFTAWSHPGRIRSEAAFAALAGVSPIPASSGNTTRHRLNRGGDRRLNRALHMSVVTRMHTDPRSRAYVERRTAEGRTPREIRRCLKRYLARDIYRQLNAATPS